MSFDRAAVIAALNASTTGGLKFLALALSKDLSQTHASPLLGPD